MKILNNDKKIVALYTRVSTIDQVQDGHSLYEQENRLKKMCEAKGYEIYKVYTDAGISAKDTNRPAYKKMLKDMKERKFNLIFAYKLDRISRSIIDLEMLFNLLKENNCDIECLVDNIDTSGANGMMFVRILGIFAQFERELIKERTLIGVESAVNQGHFGGKPPLGYMQEVVNGKKTKKWIINNDEAKIVKEIFELCLNGKTYATIANIMNEKYPKVVSGYKIDKSNNVRKEVFRNWKDSSICVMLNNKRYIGIHEHRKSSKEKETVEIRGKIPPIISEETFYECQDNIKKNARNYYRNKNYLFMQKLVCPKCGRIMACNGARRKQDKDYLYYKCKDCGEYIREEWVEKILIENLVELLEMYLIIEDSYYPIDNNLTDDFNNCKINNSIRFAIDSRIIDEKKKNIICSNEFFPIWNNAPYEVKCKFIYEYIDIIKVKKKKVKNEKEPRIELSELKIKSNKIQKLFELREKGMLDEIVDYENYKFSISTFKNENEAYKYIDILKNKYNISVKEELLLENDYYYNDTLFKVINVLPSKAIEKPKSIFLEIQ